MKKKPRYAVLLAAKEGENWIEDQIKSILFQKNVIVDIYISIDKSKDKTELICRTLAKKYSNLKLVKKNNLSKSSSSRNFFWLIANVNYSTYDYVALADQDDIWFEDKLVRAKHCLKKHNVDGYSSNVTCLYPGGEKKELTKCAIQSKYDFLFESAGAGCTYVFVVQKFELLKCFIKENFRTVSKLKNHDWFIYSFFRSRGFSWFIDKKSTMLYRQHGSNLMGANNNYKAVAKRLTMIFSGWYKNEVEKNYSIIRMGICMNNTFNVRSKWKCILYFYQLRRKFFHKFFLLSLILFGIY
jgi:rhamnosyltransferase